MSFDMLGAVVLVDENDPAAETKDDLEFPRQGFPSWRASPMEIDPQPHVFPSMMEHFPDLYDLEHRPWGVHLPEDAAFDWAGISGDVDVDAIVDLVAQKHAAHAVGAAIEDVIKKAYYPVSVNNATHILEQAYEMFQEARAIAKGGLAERNLGVDQTIANQMNAVDAFARALRADPKQGRAVSNDEWEKTRNFVRAAMSQWAAVNEGRAYQNRVFDQFLEEVAQNAAALPGAAAGGLIGMVPWWGWLVAGIVALGAGAYFMSPVIGALAAWKRR
jgi:hypothetical protein